MHTKDNIVKKTLGPLSANLVSTLYSRNRPIFHFKEAAEILGINQPKVSALSKGILSGFSLERLICFLNLLKKDVEIVVKDKPARSKTQGRLNVVFTDANGSLL